MRATSILSVCAVLAFGFGGCASVEQLHRDSLRYDAMHRGTEVYELNPAWVFDSGNQAENGPVSPKRAAAELGREQLVFYEKYRRVADMYRPGKRPAVAAEAVAGRPPDPDPAAEKVTGGNQSAEASVQQSAPINKAPTYPMSAQLGAANDGNAPTNDGAMTPTPIPPVPSADQVVSQVEVFWPATILDAVRNKEKVTATGDGKTVTERTAPDADLVRALSSTVSVAQMRDLLTEPTFPSLPPVRREVVLGCLPPPDQAAFTASSGVSANLAKIMANGDIKNDATVQAAASYASQVQKMFEESERTMFLQYALYRLCEMSVNAPSEFRNVYPVVVHDIVRRTAELREMESAEGLKVKAAAESRKAEEAKAEQARENRRLEEQRAITADRERAAQTARKAAEDASRTRDLVSDDVIKSQQALLDKRVGLLVAKCVEAAIPEQDAAKADVVSRALESCRETYSALRH